jgi:NADP-dependent 3-hydroxy acid dehydrogenase YdfG
MTLQGKTAVVTGASSGLGAAIGRDIVARGATVVGLARRMDRLEAMRDELGDRFVPVPCDVTDEKSVDRAFLAIAGLGAPVDILVNNAGLGSFGDVETLRLEDFDVVIGTNLRGLFLCTKAVLPGMRARNESTGFGGHIVNIASVAGLIGNPGLAAYNASKFGVRGFSEALMKEVRGQGIKVTCIYPGSIATDFQDTAGTGGAPNPMTAADVASTVAHVLETAENYLISEVVMRPLRPRG